MLKLLFERGDRDVLWFSVAVEGTGDSSACVHVREVKLLEVGASDTSMCIGFTRYSVPDYERDICFDPYAEVLASSSFRLNEPFGVVSLLRLLLELEAESLLVLSKLLVRSSSESTYCEDEEGSTAIPRSFHRSPSSLCLRNLRASYLCRHSRSLG